jgi:hypothetical protein
LVPLFLNRKCDRTLGKAGLKAHPHYPSWVSVGGLVSDGVAFARARAQGRSGRTAKGGHGGGYTAVGEIDRPGRGGEKSGGGKVEQSAGTSKKEKKEKRETPSDKSERKSASEKRAKGSAGGPVDAGGPEPAAAVDALAATAGHAAGGGGRWVHAPT